MNESVGISFGGEVFRYNIVSENEVPHKGDMVTTKSNYNYLEFDRTVFHNIVSQPTLDEHGHTVMENHVHSVNRKKIRTGMW